MGHREARDKLCCFPSPPPCLLRTLGAGRAGLGWVQSWWSTIERERWKPRLATVITSLAAASVGSVISLFTLGAQKLTWIATCKASFVAPALTVNQKIVGNISE